MQNSSVMSYAQIAALIDKHCDSSDDGATRALKRALIRNGRIVLAVDGKDVELRLTSMRRLAAKAGA